MKRTESISELVAALTSIKRAMHGKSYQCTSGKSLSTGQLMILFAIKHHGPISGQELAVRLAMTPGGVSQLVETLVEDNLVERTTKPQDRRVQELTLTELGEAEVASIETERLAIIRHATKELTDNELQQLVRTLQKIQRAMQQRVSE